MAGISSTSYTKLVVSGLIHQYFIAFKVCVFLVYKTFGSLLKICILKTKKKWIKLLKASTACVVILSEA